MLCLGCRCLLAQVWCWCSVSTRLPHSKHLPSAASQLSRVRRPYGLRFHKCLALTRPRFPPCVWRLLVHPKCQKTSRACLPTNAASSCTRAMASPRHRRLFQCLLVAPCMLGLSGTCCRVSSCGLSTKMVMTPKAETLAKFGFAATTCFAAICATRKQLRASLHQRVGFAREMLRFATTTVICSLSTA